MEFFATHNKNKQVNETENSNKCGVSLDSKDCHSLSRTFSTEVKRHNQFSLENRKSKHNPLTSRAMKYQPEKLNLSINSSQNQNSFEFDKKLPEHSNHHQSAVDRSQREVLRCHNCLKKQDYDNWSLDDDKVFFETPLPVDATIFLNSRQETIAIRSGLNHVIIYECSCERCTREPCHSTAIIRNRCSYSVAKTKKNLMNVKRKSWKVKNWTRRRPQHGSTHSFGNSSYNSRWILWVGFIVLKLRSTVDVK